MTKLYVNYSTKDWRAAEMFGDTLIEIGYDGVS